MYQKAQRRQLGLGFLFGCDSGEGVAASSSHVFANGGGMATETSIRLLCECHSWRSDNHIRARVAVPRRVFWAATVVPGFS